VNEEISRGKLFILSGKLRENEFCKVVGTLHLVSCQHVLLFFVSVLHTELLVVAE